jgi:F-type H+-transporting ATPase subunit a
MNNQNMVLIFKSPIEQFNIFPMSCNYDTNLTLFFFILIISLGFLLINMMYTRLNLNKKILFIFYLNENNNVILNTFLELKYIPSFFQYFFEFFIINFIIFFNNLFIWENKVIYLFIFFNTIIFILFSNLIGLVPYTFALTAQIFITLNLSLYLFISFNIIGFYKHGLNMFNLFIPSGVSMFMQILLIPIEIISYLFRPISLSIRLFSNIMAGHTLLKVICNFIIRFFKLDFFLFFYLIPYFILIILFGLELFVALIQSYVFFILI